MLESLILLFTFILFLIGIKLIIDASKDKHKETTKEIYQHTISYIFFIIPFVVVLPLSIFNSNDAFVTNTYPESHEAEQEPIFSENVQNTFIPTEDDIYQTQTTEKAISVDCILEIDNQTIKGTIKAEDQEDKFKYTAPKTGTYHFDFDISDVNNPFYFIICDSSNNPIVETSASANGTTIDLTENETYTIHVQESYGLLDYYSIFINEPTDTVIIEDNLISGSITYTDQENHYTYTAPKTGTYRFDFDISNINNPFYFYMYDSKKACIAELSASSEGKTLNLIENETYTICIREHEGLLEKYSISIGVPNTPIQIKEKNINGTINYIDQCDIYYYTAPRTGTYRFSFDCSNVNNPFYFYVYDSQKSNLAELSSSSEGKTLDLKKGEIYEIHIKEYYGLLENYTVTIGVPQKTKTITSLPIEGDISFIDQCNKYKFVAPYSGEYIFNLNIDDTTCSYKLVIQNSKKEILESSYSYNTPAEVKLTENETYTIKIIQNDGYPFKYSIIQQ